MSEKCKHKSGLNNNIKSINKLVLRKDMTILNNITFILAITIELLGVIFCNVPNFLAAITPCWRSRSSSAFSSVGHINHL
jgi:hypothetical protein